MSGAYYNTQPTRPLILTLIGVASIIIASISFIADFGQLIVAQFTTHIPTTLAATPPITSPAPNPTSIHSEYVGPQGLSATQRKAVIDGLSQVRSLTDARQKELDALLADVGQQVILLSPENLTPARVATYATEVRELPSGSGGPPDDMFILGSGRLQLSDQSAVF